MNSGLLFSISYDTVLEDALNCVGLWFWNHQEDTDVCWRFIGCGAPRHRTGVKARSVGLAGEVPRDVHSTFQHLFSQVTRDGTRGNDPSSLRLCTSLEGWLSLSYQPLTGEDLIHISWSRSGLIAEGGPHYLECCVPGYCNRSENPLSEWIKLNKNNTPVPGEDCPHEEWIGLKARDKS